MYALIKIAGVLVVVVIVGVGLAWFFQRSLVFFPDDTPVRSAGDVIDGGRDVRLKTSDGLALDAWLIPPDSSADREMAVLYAPGNGGNREDRAGMARQLSQRGFTVLLMDYRGYGGNPGSPSEDGLARDAEAAVDALEQEGFSASNTIYVGESIGTGVMARLQDSHPPAGVLLRSPFTDFAAVGSQHYPFLPVNVLLRDRFPIVDYLRDSAVPTTVIYGTVDQIVPPELSVEVAAKARNLHEELELDGVGHNDAQMFGRPVADAVSRLADAATG